MFFIAIDFGLSFLKICLIDESGREKLILKYNNRYLIGDGIYKELDLKYSLDKITESIRKIKKIKPTYFNSIKSISVSTHGQTFILIDKAGKELTNGISAFDNRATKETIEINNLIDMEKNYFLCGIKNFSELHAVPKILWLKRNNKNIFKNIRKILFIEDYIIFKITQKFIISKSMASIAGLFDITKQTWRKDIIEILGLNYLNFSEIAEPGTNIGEISHVFAKETGLGKNVNVVVGLLDGLANSLGAGNIKFDKIVECTGTVESIMVNTPKPQYNKLKIPIYHFINGMYTLAPYSPTAGILMDWFGDNFYTSKKYYTIMEKEVSEIKPKKDDIVFLPYFINASIINNNIPSRGVFFGINLNHNRSNFCHSIFESIGFILQENILAIESIIKTNINSVFSVGGGSNSEVLCQIKSNCINKEISLLENKEIGCLGVAILSAVSNNVYKNVDEAVNNMVKIRKIYNPNINLVQIYEERYQMFKEIFNNTKYLFLKYY